MDGADGLTLSIARRLGDVDRDTWDALANPDPDTYDPFISWDFLQALEEAGCTGRSAGWIPHHLLAHDRAGALVGAAPLYAKTNSYGEYVFDHAWADALHRAGGAYYPKLQCAAPFTPVTGRRLLAQDDATVAALARGIIDVARQLQASSAHITFLTGAQQAGLAGDVYLRREGVQFHWTNAGYKSFQDFLAVLSSGKRKSIRRERERACEGLVIRRLTGPEITPALWDVFFACYMDTASRKWGQPYLNRRFFKLVGERMGDRVVLFLAEAEGAPIASALNFLGGNTLYGRYWGRLADRDFLHFELCYYAAIEFAIERGLARVEAGAQGEHKLTRGYAPVPTFSAHWIAHAGLREAVARYLEQERPAVAEEIEMLGEHTPFKKDL